MKLRRCFLLCPAWLLFGLTFTGQALATEQSDRNAFKTESVSTKGSCVISGLTDLQARAIAVKIARARAIEQVAGVTINSTSLVKDMTMVLDLVKSYSMGYITKEANYKWSTSLFQPDPSSPAIIEYAVSFDATVAVPQNRAAPFGIRAELNRTKFVDGDSAKLSVKFGRDAKIGIFNITEDDRVTMLFPNDKMDLSGVLKKGQSFVFPRPESSQDLVMSTLKGYQQNTEAFMVIALDPKAPIDFVALFEPEVDLPLDKFYGSLMKIGEYIDEEILPYQVFCKSR